MSARSARYVYAAAWTLGSLPLPLLRMLARLAARLLPRNARDWQVVWTNLCLIAPALDAEPDAYATPHRVRDVLAANWSTALESLRFWTRPAALNLRRVRSVQGEAHLQTALANPNGLIVIAPHHGNWELLNQWLASRMRLAVLYAAPDSAAMDAFLQRVRAEPGVLPVAAGAQGVRQLLRHLQGGGAVGILPDQQPKTGGEGVFAPFFGRPALTMTLLPKLAARSGASLLVACAQRRPDGAFEILLWPAPEAIRDPDTQVACTAMNAAVEAVARGDLTQYQWAYKRFSRQHDGENPYWPHCYPNRDDA